MAETMVVANYQQSDVHLLRQYILNKFPCRKLTNFFSEIQQETGIYARRSQLFKTLLKGVDQQQVVIRLNQLARMVGKCDNSRLQTSATRLFLQMAKQKLMSTMHTIEETYARSEFKRHISAILVYSHF